MLGLQHPNRLFCKFFFVVDIFFKLKIFFFHNNNQNSGLVADASNPKFRDVQKLILQTAPDSGLLSLLANKM